MAYTPTYVDNNSFLTPTIWNDTQDGIKGIKTQILYDLAPTANETWADFTYRIRNELTSPYSFGRVLRLTVDGTSELYFHCMRRTSGVSLWMASKHAASSGTPTSFTLYYLAVSSSSGALRKITVDSNGFSGADLSNSEAESNIAILGLNNNE